MKELARVLSVIQKTIKAPKKQQMHGKKIYYRSVEDILEPAKQIIPEGYFIAFNDELIEFAGHVYVKTVACFTDGVHAITSTACARFDEKAAMNDSQKTGSASSYARKYALGGLFALDDSDLQPTPDPDAMDKMPPKTQSPEAAPAPMPEAELAEAKLKIAEYIDRCNHVEELRVAYKKLKEQYPLIAAEIEKTCKDRKAQLEEVPHAE